MIITNKQFPNYKKYEMTYEGRPFSMEVGKMAELCNAAVLVRYGETTVLVTCTASARPKDGIDYFPLSVDFNEKLYAVGRIPGSFMRREGKPSLNAVLASRLIDRPMRPLFPSDLRNDVVIACEVLSVDRDCSPEITAMIGASAAVSISDVPFNGPTQPDDHHHRRHPQEDRHDRVRGQGSPRRGHVRGHRAGPRAPAAHAGSDRPHGGRDRQAQVRV